MTILFLPASVPSAVSWLASLGKKPAVAAAHDDDDETESIEAGDVSKPSQKKYRFLLPAIDRRKIPKAPPFYRRGSDEEVRRQWLSTRKVSMMVECLG